MHPCATHTTQVLAHLRAESQHTISRLAHTRSLQLQLQATLAAWQLAAAQAPQQQQQQAGSSSGGSCSTAADWLGGRGRLCYAQSSSFGWPGTVCGGRAFFSLPVGGTDALQHFSAPATAVEAAAAAGADAPLPPPGSVLLWSELPAASSTAASRPRNQVHSLALSHDGGLLAVTYSCCDSAAGGSANSHALAVLDAASGDTLVQHADGVDGPVLWAAPAWAAGTAPQERAHQQQLKHLLYVSHGHRQVHCLVLPSPAAAAVGVLPQQQPQMRLVFKDPQHVSLSIAAHDGTAFIIVAAADGAPRQVLCHCSSSGGGAPDDARAWRPLLAAADAAAAAGVPAVAAGDDDASMRLAVTLAAGVALVRLSSALQPQGLLLAADMRQQQGQQQQPPQHVWHHVPLPSVEPGMRLEALFAGSTAHAGGAAGAGQQELQLLVLTVQQRQQQGERLEWGAPATRQALHAHSYTLALPGPAAAQVQQQAEACLAGCCEVPLPDPFWRLHSASWCCATGQLRISFSSLVRPHSELRVNMQQLCDQQQRQPVAAAAATADSSAQASAAAAVQLAQLLGAPRGFQQEHYAAVQLLVTAPDGARVPVSLAFRRDGLGAAERMRAPLAAGPGPGPDSSSSCGRVLLCCYGSYGIAENAGFQSELLPLLDAGWCVAVAHVRGGGALGRRWAEAGRGAGKAASVGDLLAVARHLVQVRTEQCACTPHAALLCCHGCHSIRVHACSCSLATSALHHCTRAGWRGRARRRLPACRVGRWLAGRVGAAAGGAGPPVRRVCADGALPRPAGPAAG